MFHVHTVRRACKDLFTRKSNGFVLLLILGVNILHVLMWLTNIGCFLALVSKTCRNILGSFVIDEKYMVDREILQAAGLKQCAA